MRFNFNDASRPEAFLSGLADHLLSYGIEVDRKGLENILADFFGHESWLDLIDSVGLYPPSIDDDFCNEHSLDARRRNQIDALMAAGLTRAQAIDVIYELHPTNRHPLEAVIWRHRDGCDWLYYEGRFISVSKVSEGMDGYAETIDAGLLGPASIVVLHGKVDFDGDDVTISDESVIVIAETIEEAEFAALLTLETERRHIREILMLDRDFTWFEDGDIEDSPVGPIRSIEILGDGIARYCGPDNDDLGYLRLDAELARELPPFMATRLLQDGAAWFPCSGCGLLVAMAMPQFFSTVEVAKARIDCAEHYPTSLGLIEGEIAPTEDALTLARGEVWQGHSHAGWVILEASVYTEGVKGTILVKAVMPARTDTEEKEETGHFLVPKGDLDGPDFILDVDRYLRVDPLKLAPGPSTLRH